MNWSALVAQLSGAEYRRGVVTAQTPPHRLRFAVGLSDAEVQRLEQRHALRLPPDLRAFLQTALPVGPGFPDWRGEGSEAPRAWMAGVEQGVLFDVEHNDFWLDDWGARPAAVADALSVAGGALRAAPPLVPVFGHRMLPTEPTGAGNPVLSLHQTDVLCYGFDLEDYLRHEFELGGRRPWPDQLPEIPFWGRLL